MPGAYLLLFAGSPQGSTPQSTPEGFAQHLPHKLCAVLPGFFLRKMPFCGIMKSAYGAVLQIAPTLRGRTMKRVVQFFRRETVLCISGLLAVGSAFAVPPGRAYLDYIDFRVLILLLCLMLTVAGIRQTGAFTVLCQGLLRRFRSLRTVGLLLVLLCFGLSMLLTNDVTLVTLVPFTLLLLESIPEKDTSRITIRLLVLETAAANLGSMLTPMGNPQNLYLYSRYSFSMQEFFCTIAPYSALSLLLLAGSAVLLLPAKPIAPRKAPARIEHPRRLGAYCLLFGVNLLTVLRILNPWILLGIICAGVLLLDRRLFLQADYSLLLTFVFFFVFVGNLGSIPALSGALQTLLEGRELLTAVLLSQAISNVPAAILLSGLTEKGSALLIGTNLGGLGTLIASMASLITYKLYAAVSGSKPRRYLAVFTICNLVYLGILLLLYLVLS